MNLDSEQPRSLKRNYIRKVMNGLKNMKIALAKIRANPRDRNAAMEIRGTAEAISELAMLHGHPGVESIARKISTSFKLARVEAEPGFLSKIELTIKGIKRVVSMEEKLESKLIIKKITRVDTGPIANLSNLGNLEEKQHRIVELENDKKLLFDINESDFLSNTSFSVISKA